MRLNVARTQLNRAGERPVCLINGLFRVIVKERKNSHSQPAVSLIQLKPQRGGDS